MYLDIATDQLSPVLPDYKGACTVNVISQLMSLRNGGNGGDGDNVAAWMPSAVEGARQVVVLVLDGLGWEQFQARLALAPTLAAMEGRAITTVAPTTTVTGLSSITTGLPPAVHGLLGHSVRTNGEVLNILRWHHDSGHGVPPEPTTFQSHPAFAGAGIPAVILSHFIGTGFTNAHLRNARLFGYPVASSLPLEVVRLLKAGESLVYAYYGGIDTVSHAYGFGEYYDAELSAADQLVGQILAGMPHGAALVVIADHGQMQVDDRMITLDPELVSACTQFSGEARFRWLKAKDGAFNEVVAHCRERYGHLAWVRTVDEIDDEGWFGPRLSTDYRQRLGDVALVPQGAEAFRNPHRQRKYEMRCHHGSLTSSEVLVPLLAMQV